MPSFSVFVFCSVSSPEPSPLKRAQPGSAWMARNRCHASTMALRERQRLELAVTLNLTSNRKTRVSRIFQPSKRSGSVRKPSFSVYYFVSLSHLSTLSPSWLGTDWWRRTHTENLLELMNPQDEYPRVGTLGMHRERERSQQAAFFFLSGPALITSRVSLFFFVFVFSL